MLQLFSRRSLALYVAALPAGLSLSAPVLPASMASADSTTVEGLTKTATAIHQEVHFDASPDRVYQALTTAKTFDALTRLSDASALLTAPGAQQTMISAHVGGGFTLFGGYITGINLEFVKDKRLVQAWRTGGWDAGDYSIVKFVLRVDRTGTQLTFDQLGFPADEGGHLAAGWHSHYWEPLKKLLAH